MIGYTTLGTNDLIKASAFYDELLGELGASRFMDEEGFIAWGTKPGEPLFSITTPFDGNVATVGNGVMIALFGEDQEQVKTLHAKALSLGAQDEGAPGPRGESGFYGAYCRDLDGNKIAFFCM